VYSRSGPPKFLARLLVQLDLIIGSISERCRFGEAIVLEALSDEYHYTNAYLWSWMLYLRLLTLFPFTADMIHIRTDLVAYVTEQHLHQTLLDYLFKLISDCDNENDDGALINSIQTLPTETLLEKLNVLQSPTALSE